MKINLNRTCLWKWVMIGVIGIIIMVSVWTVLFSRFAVRNSILKQYQNGYQAPGQLTITYPWNGSLFPPDIAAPTIFWQDSLSNIKHWCVFINGDSILDPFVSWTGTNQWRPDSFQWESIKSAGLEQNLTITVLGCKGKNILSGAEIHIGISQDSVGASIFYRAVPLPFSYALRHLEEIRWHLGNIGSAKPSPALLKDLPFCGNCHSFPRDGSTLAMDVDYANDKGSYVISEIEKETVLTPDKVITWSDFRREDGGKTFGLLSQISPCGRYVASTLKDRSIFVAIDEMYYSQLFFPIKGIIAIYDRETKRYAALPGADDPNYVQSNPTWSPDGKTIYFAKETAYIKPDIEASDAVVLPTSMAAEFIEGRRGFQYDIYRIPFNKGKGGKPEPVSGASNNGMSNYFPKISPDGKWLVFTQAKNFMLLQPDARLYIMPADGGTPRKMNCNKESMNSWHSWSPNSKWLVFASKFRRAYTDLLLTHIDDNGQDTPPVWLEYLSFDDRTINIPEFIDIDPSDWTAIVDRFSHQSQYYFTIGRHKLGEEKYQEAIQAFDQAVQMDSNFVDGIVYKGHAEFYLGRYQKALQTYHRALHLDPKSRGVHINMGTALYKLKRYPEALKAYHKAIREDPENAYPYFARGLVKAQLDDFKGAIQDFDQSIALRPQSYQVYYERGVCKALQKDYQGAAQDFTRVTELQTEHFESFEKLGNCHYHLRSYQKAIHAYDQALMLRPGQGDLHTYRGLCKMELNDLRAAMEDFNQAITLEPNAAVNYYHRGCTYIGLKMKSEACADFYRARDLGYQKAEKEIRRYCLK